MSWKKPKEYDQLIASRRWVLLRAAYLRQHPLCERCLDNGFIVSAYLVHHKRPVETGHTYEEMEMLCFNPANLQALCKRCHGQVHHELASQTKEGHQANADRNLQRWVASRKKKGTKL